MLPWSACLRAREIPMLKPDVRCDSIWRRGPLGREPSRMGLVPSRKRLQRALLPLPPGGDEAKGAGSELEEGCHQHKAM